MYLKIYIYKPIQVFKMPPTTGLSKHPNVLVNCYSNCSQFGPLTTPMKCCF